jgi:hypothetical protein
MLPRQIRLCRSHTAGGKSVRTFAASRTCCPVCPGGSRVAARGSPVEVSPVDLASLPVRASGGLSPVGHPPLDSPFTSLPPVSHRSRVVPPRSQSSPPASHRSRVVPPRSPVCLRPRTARHRTTLGFLAARCPGDGRVPCSRRLSVSVTRGSVRVTDLVTACQ